MGLLHLIKKEKVLLGALRTQLVFVSLLSPSSISVFQEVEMDRENIE